jgi:DNA repair protein RadC
MKKDRFDKYLNKVRENLELKVGEIIVDYAIAPEKVSELPKITQSSHAFDFALQRWESDICATERFKVMYLNNQNRVIGWFNLSKGATTGTTIDVKLMLAISLNIPSCKSLITLHNHHSCNTIPSEADKEMSKKIKEALKLIDMILLDNLIITKESFLSFADEGLM